MLKVPSTRIQLPKIRYGNTTDGIDEQEAKWNLDNKSFLLTDGGDLPYVVLYENGFTPARRNDVLNNFKRQLQGRKVGIPVCLDEIPLNFGKTFATSLTNGLKRASQLTDDGDEPKLVILMLRNKDQDCYSTFKYLADMVFGFSSIVMVEASNVRKREWAKTGLDQYCGNLLMKANLKLGGINHTAEGRSAFGNIAEHLSNTLVLGAAVTHPSNGALLGCPSVAALVGSVEATGGRLLGCIRLQSEGSKEVSISKWFLKLHVLRRTDHR
jgi:eukaryotic translation initiation factor 2C